MSAAARALLSHWLRHPGQLVTLLAGLALATALWSGVQAVNSEARKSYAAAATALGQDRLDRLVPARGRSAQEEFVALRRAGWQVSPVVEGVARLGGVRLRLIGIEPLTAPADSTLSGIGDAEIPLDDFLAGRLALIAPETPDLRELPEGLELRAASDVPPRTIVMDIGAAQRLLGREGIDYLVVGRAQPLGLPPLEEISDLSRVGPDEANSLGELTESFHLNLTAFGFLSFAVGLFIVQAAIGLAFEQRRPTFRTLRAVGVSLRQLVALLALELGMFALIAGMLGLAIGYAIAALLLPGVAGTLRSLYGATLSGEMAFDPVWALAALGMTALGTAAAGAQALWKVSRMPLLAPAWPRAWAQVSYQTLRVQVIAALALLGASAGFAVWGGSLLAGFACLAGLLLGAALLLPACLVALLQGAGRFVRAPFGEWLFADARQQVPALSLALMALLLALAANVGVGTMVGSFRVAFTQWLDQRLAAELYVTARSADEAAAVRSYLEPVSTAVLPIWGVERQISGRGTEVFGIRDHATYRENWPLLAGIPGLWERIASGQGVLINEQMARARGIWTSDTVDLGEGWRLPVVGVYSDYGNTRWQAIVGFETLAARHPGETPLRYAVRLPSSEVDMRAADLRDRFDLPDTNVVNQAQVKAFSLDVFDRTFLVTGALNVLTLGVAGFALLTSLLTLSRLRIPQLAPVWAIGVPPKTLATTELARSVVLAALTWLLALPVGLALAWILLAIVNVEAFGWRLPMRLFPADWLRLGLLALLVAALATLWPALRLTRLPPMQLLRIFASER